MKGIFRSDAYFIVNIAIVIKETVNWNLLKRQKFRNIKISKNFLIDWKKIWNGSNDAIVFVREEQYSIDPIEIRLDDKNLFFFLISCSRTRRTNEIYSLSCVSIFVWIQFVFLQKFVGKIEASIFNRFVLIHDEKGSPPLPFSPVGSHLFKFEEAERWLWSSSLGSLTTPHLLASRSLLSNVERVSHVSAIQFHYSWSGNAAFAVLFKENGWNQRLACIYRLGWVGW